MNYKVPRRRTGHISGTVSDIKMSAIKEMAMRSAKIEDAVSLSWGLPSFSTPEYIRAGVMDGLQAEMDIGMYTLPDGLKTLRQAVAARHLADTGVVVDPDENIIITAGNMQAMSTLFRVITEPGDEIILTDPCFPSHIQQITLSGGTPVYWALDPDNNWELDVDALPSLINERTRALVIVSPSNPSGKIFSQTAITAMAEITRQYGLLLLVDDPYHHFTYENKSKYFNPASLKDQFDHMVYCFSFSKAYAMSGWRAGYMVLPGYLKEQVLKVHDADIICAPRVSQVAAHIALTGQTHHHAEFESTLAARRQLICERLDAVPHVFDYVKPEGAYYVFPRIRVEHRDSYNFAIQLLNTARVAVTPGSAFGPAGEHHVRMAYCVSEEAINLAFDRIKACY